MSKTTCESIQRITMRFLKQRHYLQDGWIGGSIHWTSAYGKETSAGIRMDIRDGFGHLQLTYTISGWSDEKTDMDYRVEVVSTPCYFGGRRYWFICPLMRNGVACYRRIGVLYLGGKYFGCRRCYDLAYKSQKETHSGPWSVFGKCLFSGLEEREDAMRVKYWRGRPTKRYRRLLRKMDGLPTLAMVEAANQEIMGRSQRHQKGL